jgi:hypothetical protein
VTRISIGDIFIQLVGPTVGLCSMAFISKCSVCSLLMSISNVLQVGLSKEREIDRVAVAVTNTFLPGSNGPLWRLVCQSRR